jgi:VanZ family protein
MMPKDNSYHNAAMRLIFFFTALVVIGFALYPNLVLPRPEITKDSSDLINHAIAFSLLSFLGVAAWSLSATLTINLFLFAVLLELAQSLSPGRAVSLQDVAASLAGIAAAMFFLFIFRQLRYRLRWND